MMSPGGGEPADVLDPVAGAVRAVAVLDDASRRAMYLYIRSAHRPVTREQAAAASGISRKLAAFHLDKLVDAGLLSARYDTQARGHALGRPPKVYEPSSVDIAVAIPERHPGVLADILVTAITSARPQEPARDAALRVAAERGRELGGTARRQLRAGRLGSQRALSMAERSMREQGYEPFRATPSCIRLRNCPFHPLAGKAPELVCGLNHALLTGYLEGARTQQVQAILRPRAGECCVELRIGGGAA